MPKSMRLWGKVIEFVNEGAAYWVPVVSEVLQNRVSPTVFSGKSPLHESFVCYLCSAGKRA